MTATVVLENVQDNVAAWNKVYGTDEARMGYDQHGRNNVALSYGNQCQHVLVTFNPSNYCCEEQMADHMLTVMKSMSIMWQAAKHGKGDDEEFHVWISANCHPVPVCRGDE